MFKKYGYFSVHAECHAMMDAATKGGGNILVVVRISKNGQYSCSKPCEKCIQAAKDYKIKKIYYTDWDASIKEIKL